MGLRARRDEESAEEETGVLEDILFELVYYRLKYDVLFTYISDFRLETLAHLTITRYVNVKLGRRQFR